VSEEPRYVLGIDTSCDDTAAAVVDRGRTILSNVVASQVSLHQPWGGIVPEVASRAHLENILPVVESALAGADITFDSLEAIGVTTRPGLVGSLLVGLSAAKALAFALDLPLVGVHHIEGHIQSGLLAAPDLRPPFLSLVVSGGHTQLFRCESASEYELLGQTLDDAVGEAFDKVAAMLGLSYPGGPSIQRAAETGDPKAISFPVHSGKGSLDFSYSGLKTAVLYHLKGQNSQRGGLGPARAVAGQELADIAASFQEAAVDQLLLKVRRAVKKTRVRAVCVGGGVACNQRLREKLSALGAKHRFRVVFPSFRLCTDNAAMIASLAYLNFVNGREVGLDQLARPR
jgi:N6-L-threonylcarbamoyladenine synthase